MVGLVAVLAVWGSYHAIAGWVKPASITEDTNRHREDNPANAAAIDSALHLLRDGDLVVRTGADAISVMLRQMNLQDKTYSHCGIVMIEDGYPFVYHSIGGEDNPDERLRRDSAAFFFSPIYNERMGIARLDLTSRQIEQLHAIVRRYYAARIPFDMDFDMATDDKLYCAEFVYKAIGECVGDPAYFEQSHVLDRSYVGVDNLTDERHAKIICDVRYKL
jgi:hypothetical protein